MDAITVRAAGGLVARDGSILLVHRPRFDDWSLPKGKLKRGEHPLAAAVREVREETAVGGVPGVRLPSVTYPMRSGQSPADKTVDWWAMTAAEVGPFTPSDEVDELAWLPIPRALEVLTYERDRRVVSAYADLPPLSRPVVLVRPASVDERRPWSGPDSDRPLDAPGADQAAALARLLPLLAPGRLISAPPVRCRQTLADLARALAIEVEIDARFDHDANPDAALAALAELRSLAGDTVSVVCGHARGIPAAVAQLCGRPEAEQLRMGDALVLSFAGDTLVAADPLTPNATR